MWSSSSLSLRARDLILWLMHKDLPYMHIYHTKAAASDTHPRVAFQHHRPHHPSTLHPQERHPVHRDRHVRLQRRLVLLRPEGALRARHRRLAPVRPALGPVPPAPWLCVWGGGSAYCQYMVTPPYSPKTRFPPPIKTRNRTGSAAWPPAARGPGTDPLAAPQPAGCPPGRRPSGTIAPLCVCVEVGVSLCKRLSVRDVITPFQHSTKGTHRPPAPGS